MYLRIKKEIIIDTPAEKVWQVVAHQFGAISQWATALTESQPSEAPVTPNGATCSGRVCTAPGFGDIYETFTYYDEAAMRYGYVASRGMPSFVQKAESNWSVELLSPTQTRVNIRGEIDLKLIPGLFLYPIFKYQMSKLVKQTMAELKYYIEHGQPHPHKQKQLQQTAT